MAHKVKVTAIGAGNISWHLTQALSKIGCEIVEVYSRKKSNARRLASHYNCAATDRLEKINMESELYLVMVSDDAIRSVVSELPTFHEKQFLAHTSGSEKSTVLSLRAINYGCFYPLQSFKEKQEMDLSKIPFLIYGSSPATTRFLRMLARKISSKVSEINDHERLQYHLSAVFINNFTNHLACISSQYLKDNQLDPKIMKPIMESTFQKILNKKPCDNQTGPAVRGDVKLQKKHIVLLQEHPEWKSIYKSISKSISKQYESPK